MRFHLKINGVPPIEVDNTGVIFKDRKAPWFIQLAGDLHDGTFHQVIDSLFTEIDFRLESLVAAVLRPCLRDSFQLDISGLAA